MSYEQLKLDNQLTRQAYWPYFEPLGITYPQYLVLLVLWEKDQQPVNDIAKRLYLETNTDVANVSDIIPVLDELIEGLHKNAIK